MVKRAFSKHLQRNISVEDAHKMSISNMLTDSRDFICSDINCQISLTCTNWGKHLNSNSKLYFTPSSNDELHISACSEAGVKEEKERSKYETQNAKATIQKNGLIVLRKIYEPKNTVKNSNQNSTIEPNKTQSIKSNSVNTQNSTSKAKTESSYITSLLTLIELYNDINFNNTNQILKINKNTFSLDEFFIILDLINNIPTNKLGIFYGTAILQTFDKNKNMLEIKFTNPSIPNIYSNKQSILNSFNRKIAKQVLDKKIPIKVYFRGSRDRDLKKWLPYNDKVYQDIFLNI